MMVLEEAENKYFYDYFADWVEMYKRGAVSPITFQKYVATLNNLKGVAPALKVCELNKRSYQSIINNYAASHERQTVKDFHTHLKAAVLDAMEEGVIKVSPCRNVVIKGTDSGKNKKIKALSVDEFDKLLCVLDLSGGLNWNTFIYLVAKTGMRFAEALAVTASDFDFEKQTLSVSKSCDYKGGSMGFISTKTKSSVRKIAIDDKTNNLFRGLAAGKGAHEKLFVRDGVRVFNSTVNNHLSRLCKKAQIPSVSVHGLRHTHASILFYKGVSILSVSKRLGHANVNITQSTYLHIIRDLEDKDAAIIAACFSKR